MRRPAMHSIWLVLVLSVLSCSVSAGTLGDLTYRISDGEVAITDCKTSAEGELVIPDEIEGLPVTSIGDEAFQSCSSLTSINIPDSVTSIGDKAFRHCISLTTITIPDGVTSIGDEAFSNCSSLTSITIPEGVTSIGNWAFSRCSSLTSIAIPESVTSIGSSAFNGCTSLTSITIPDSVTSIGNWAFNGCTSLTSITIPDSVTSIGEGAFFGCINLTSITIPDSVTSIGSSAFRSCSNLTSITIPEAVTIIWGRAFMGCSSLTSITIPDSVTSIGIEAFRNCRSLTSITIPVKFHSRLVANRLHIGDLYPEGFFPYPSPRRAKATPVLTNGFLTELLITDLGARYTEAPVVTITGGGGSGAEAVAVLDDWHVVSIEIINAGRGYTSEPTVLIDYPVEVPPTSVSIRMVPAITVTGEFGQTETIEVADTADGPWTEWRTVTIGEQGTTEVDLDEGAEKRFYRVRD